MTQRKIGKNISPSYVEPEGLPPLVGAVLPDEHYRNLYQQFESVEEEVIASLEEVGLPVRELEKVRAPEPFPEIDIERIALEGPNGYERAYNLLLKWQGFLATLLARADNHVLATKNGLKAVSDSLHKELMKQLRAKELSNLEELAAVLGSHPVVCEATLRHQRAQERRNLIRSYFDRVQEQIKAVSRHITIRDQETRFSPDRTQKPGQLPGLGTRYQR